MTAVQLPDQLVRNLRAFERRLWKLESLLALSVGLCGLIGAFLLLFLSDRLWNTPVPLRATLAAGAAGCLLAAAFFWGRHWVWRRRGILDLALMVQRQHPNLGDRLQGILELATDSADQRASGMSPALRQAAIRQVAAECQAYDFRRAASRRGPLRVVAVLAALALLSGGLWLLAPGAGISAWSRLVQPFGATERYTFSRLAPLPSQRVVVHGEPFSQEIRHADEGLWKAAVATVTLAGQRQEVRFIDGVATAKLNGITRPEIMRIESGDARDFLRLQPVHRPSLKRLYAEIELPEYLRHPLASAEIGGQELSVLAGSRVTLVGEANQPLASAVLTGDASHQVPVQAHRLRTPPLMVTELMQLTLDWRDGHGFAPHKPRTLTLRPVEDRPPRASCPRSSRSVAILITEALPIIIHAEDDYGVREIGIDYTVTPRNVSPSPGQRALRLKVWEGGPRERTLEETIDFAPAALDVPAGHVVRYRAYALDFRPDAEPSWSDEYTIHVLSPAEHAALIRDRMTRLQGAVEEVARSEAELLEGKMEMLEKGSEWLQGEEAMKQLQEQEAKESANTEELQRLAREGLELMEEAMRNEDFDGEALQEWSKILTTMQSVAHQAMPRLTETLRDAQRSTARREEELASARDQQQDILEQLREMSGSLDESLQGLVARSFAMRLRELSGDETKLVTVLHTLVGETLGMSPADLAEPLRQQLAAQAEGHDDIAKRAAELLDDLRGFTQRATIGVYLATHHLMVEAGLPDAIQADTRLITDNLLGQAINACTRWGEQFAAWAELLDPRGDDDEGDGQGEEQQMSEEQLKAMLTLLRILQEEHEIRDQTRLIENQKSSMSDHAARATALAERQFDAFHLLLDLEDIILSMRLKPLFSDVGTAMIDAGNFLYQPETGQPAIAAESHVIELLASLISSSSQQLSSSSPQLSALMMQMLGMIQSGKGSATGDEGGGNTDDHASAVSASESDGRADGAREDRRAGERASGAWSQQIPEEFRDVLESYYRRVEQLQRPAAEVEP